MVLEDSYVAEERSYDTSRRERSSRSTYQRAMLTGTFNPGTDSSAPTRVTVLASTGANFMSKLKRIQATLVVPKTTTLFAGWFGFMRQPEGLGAPTVTGFGDAALLRPSLFVSNTDNASYWTAYLPAVNLTGTGVLWFVAVRTSGSLHACDYAIRYVEERGL